LQKSYIVGGGWPPRFAQNARRAPFAVQMERHRELIASACTRTLDDVGTRHNEVSRDKKPRTDKCPVLNMTDLNDGEANIHWHGDYTQLLFFTHFSATL
jgi:hypothetical protein